MKYIPDKAWNDFKNKYISEDIRDIAQGLVTTLIIMVFESQMEAFKNSQRFYDLRTDYYNLIREYTDMTIPSPEGITIYVESKENFDTKYQGSWYNYFS